MTEFPPQTRIRPLSNDDDDEAQFFEADETSGLFVQRRRVRTRPRVLHIRDARPLYAAGTGSSRHSRHSGRPHLGR